MILNVCPPNIPLLLDFNFLYFSNLAVVLYHYCLSLVKKKIGDIITDYCTSKMGFNSNNVG